MTWNHCKCVHVFGNIKHYCWKCVTVVGEYNCFPRYHCDVDSESCIPLHPIPDSSHTWITVQLSLLHHDSVTFFNFSAHISRSCYFGQHTGFPWVRREVLCKVYRGLGFMLCCSQGWEPDWFHTTAKTKKQLINWHEFYIICCLCLDFFILLILIIQSKNLFPYFHGFLHSTSDFFHIIIS